MTTNTPATQRGWKAQIVKRPTPAVAAVVALAAGAVLVAAPDGNARPPREVEDARTSCVSKPSGAWQRNGVLGFICTYRTGSYYILQHVNTRGSVGQVCYRFDAEAPWTCS